ncbi:peptidoglycan-associated lipoprotein Pal [Sulfurimonas sp.]|uniref:peptidoglycan-associated lipoprotein Pal n=1 Tax=Sulfurimonas sp. TaxID=2022749 RepID=UPI002603A245|nr:peptidoglycan-associated lipoprotein Pal [Sulfurimonas sp.]
MKSIVLSSVVIALLVFSGCSSKEPAVDAKAMDTTEVVDATPDEEVAPIATETVTSEESVVNSSTNELDMETIENKLPTIYFAFDKYDITPDMQEKIDAAAELGKEVSSTYKVKLEGNCDEWGSDEYNFALGLKRANAVKQALVNDGVDSSRISLVSYGESNPVCTEHTKECWSKNRRVDFKLLP